MNWPKLRSWPDDKPCCAARKVTRWAALGCGGTTGLSKASLTAAIRVYRLLPGRHRWHPNSGSSALGLAAARAGFGVAGVRAAIDGCGCHA